jgi:arylformamidase
MPVWPDSPGVATRLRMAIDRGDGANVTQLSMDVHTGTHVDAPRHFVADGPELEPMGLDPFIGPADVVDLSAVDSIDSAALAIAVPDDAERVLLRTRNSVIEGFREPPFRTDYASIDPDGAGWLVQRRLALVGVDYLSVQGYDDPPDTHTALLGARICLLEGLVLNHVAPGRYLLVCLPLRLCGVEAAPARAVLLQVEGTTA